MNQNTVTILAAIDFAFIIWILLFSIMTYVQIQRDPLDVNGDGEANIVDLSVLAAKLNEKSL